MPDSPFSKKKDKKDKTDLSSEGPQVISLSKNRKLVAAGTAEDVEIKMELLEGEDSGKDSNKQPLETKESPKKSK